ncbi:efflux RND transporter periplasmic adaptor subunit [Algoriphagus machipongonensis]|uniref:Metal transport-related, exported protein n=1 Tax=Algoriphagus machipongonensis TaxID=388413 RepID=A3HS34_9BACT|nr:efflux RND transporter periplasmic adaptor subunit [Algoriphagus machipongonensis]EAZ82652.1 putative metal transport-related, exported protein [Algoriphagus machipongonensis]
MKKLQKHVLIISIGMLFTGLLAGYLIFGNSNSQDEHQHDLTEENGVWTCSMHPQIKQNEPGTCPICGMDLIPLENDLESIDPLSISMSPTAMQLANVQTAIVGSSGANKSVKLSGKVQADERLNYTQTSHIPGRIEELKVNFTGEFISKGQVIATIYSPELTTAQNELLQAAKIQDSQPELFQAAKNKLKNWKISDAQISEILNNNTILRNFPIRANVSGYVTEKLANLGDHLQQGQAIYEVADLSRVWVLFDIYETDLSWIKVGDEIEYSIQSLPGETFTGKISYIDPLIDPASRVAKARIEVSNPKGKFKPEMFASGTIKAALNSNTAMLSVPKSAVLWTGKRSVVYVKNTSENGIRFKLREVTLGPSLGDTYVIEEGLQGGEEIAINGTFSIDAAAQLAGKPSMMSPDGGVPMTGHNHGEMQGTMSSTSNSSLAISPQAKYSLKPVYDNYLKLKDALTKDELNDSKEAAKSMEESINKVNMALFTGDAHTQWMTFEGNLKKSLTDAKTAKNIDELRKSFQSISDEMVKMTEQFHAYSETLYVQHCPMADSNQGADWLSLDKNIVNPYFGESMLTCGEVIKIID